MKKNTSDPNLIEVKEKPSEGKLLARQTHKKIIK